MFVCYKPISLSENRVTPINRKLAHQEKQHAYPNHKMQITVHDDANN